MELRLFPLAEVVLFPGMTLPLQVFEPRYRQLVAECVQGNEPFGVALIREGDEVGGPAVPRDIGTTARIKSAAAGADGQLHLVTVGGRRFRILVLHHDRPYLWGDVEYPPDEAATVPPAHIVQAREGLRRVLRLRQTVAGEFERDPRVPQSPGALADAIAGLADAPAAQLQRVLETANVGERLDAVLPLLDAVVAGAQQQALVASSARWSAFGMAN